MADFPPSLPPGYSITGKKDQWYLEALRDTQWDAFDDFDEARREAWRDYILYNWGVVPCASCRTPMTEGQGTNRCSKDCVCVGALYCVVCWNLHIDRKKALEEDAEETR